MEQKKLEKTQQRVDQNFQKNENQFFYDKISKILKDGLENNKLQESFDKITIVNGKLTKDLTLNQFVYLGAISYMVGLDFTTQEYLKEDIVKRIRERLYNVLGTDFSMTEATKYCDIISVINEENISKTKNTFINKIENPINFDNETYKIKFYELFSLAKTFIYNGTIPVNLAEETNKILSKNPKDISGLDMLKINSIIHENLKFEGKIIHKYVKLHSSDLWSLELQKASELFDNKKFGIIYFDSILTLTENLNRLNTTNVKNDVWLCDILFSNMEINFDIYHNPNKKEEIEPKTEETHTYKNRYDGVEIQRILQEDPDEAVIEIFRDIVKEDVDELDFNQLKTGTEYLLNDLEYASNLYQFFVTSVNSPKRTYKVVNEEFNNWLKEKHNELETLYKEDVEFSCAPIESELLKNIVKILDEIIDDVVLSNMEIKQYLINQKLQNSIHTYNHLLEIITMIESSEIKGSGMNNYVKLYNLLNSDETTKNSFEKIENIEKLTQQFKILTSIKNWFIKPIEK